MREAIIAANNEPNGSTITINIPASNHTLSLVGIDNTALLGDLDVNHATAGTKTINIVGVSAATSIITGLAGDRVFDVHPVTGAGAFLTFNISNVTVTGANLAAGSGSAMLTGRAGDVTTITNCIFSNNISASNGGVISQSSGATAHDLTITNSTFTNNTATGAVGGAVNYNGVGNVTITGCTFTNNTAGTQGGAININGTGTGPVSTNILRNTFSGNTANGATFGGAVVAVTNAQTVNINFNRILGNNTAPNVATGKKITSGGGVITTYNTDNNWWGVNTGPAAANVDILGSTAANWLQLKATASPTSVAAGGVSTVTASFLTNSTNAAVSLPNLSTVIGLPISFENAILGTLSGAQTTIQASGTATVTYTAGVVSGAGSVNAVVDGIPNSEVSPARANITITASPSVGVTGTPLAAFTSCLGIASAEQSFNASGSDLTADITITAPVGFEVSTTSGSGFASSVTLTQVAGSVPSTPIFVRMTAAAIGTPSGNITVASTGATTVNVAVSGTVNNPPTTSFAGNDAAVCALNTTLAANSPAVGTGAWTQVAGPGTTTFGDATSPVSTVIATVSGIYTYRWTITNAPCPASTDDVDITFAATPPAANAGSDQTVCATPGSAVMAGNAATPGTGAWTFISGPVTPTIVAPASETTNITGMTTAGTYTFRWTISNLPCPASSDDVDVVVVIPVVTDPADQIVCNGIATAAVTFTGGVPGTSYTWTNNTPSIGLAASGTGDIASFTATNTGATPVIATITVTPVVGSGC